MCSLLILKKGCIDKTIHKLQVTKVRYLNLRFWARKNPYREIRLAETYSTSLQGQLDPGKGGGGL